MKRYNVITEKYKLAGMKEDPAGEYVSYADMLDVLKELTGNGIDRESMHIILNALTENVDVEEEPLEYYEKNEYLLKELFKETFSENYIRHMQDDFNGDIICDITEIMYMAFVHGHKLACKDGR